MLSSTARMPRTCARPLLTAYAPLSLSVTHTKTMGCGRSAAGVSKVRRTNAASDASSSSVDAPDPWPSGHCIEK